MAFPLRACDGVWDYVVAGRHDKLSSGCLGQSHTRSVQTTRKDGDGSFQEEVPGYGVQPADFRAAGQGAQWAS
eukprot:5955058-Pyramimonas_sp.AAC.2